MAMWVLVMAPSSRGDPGRESDGDVVQSFGQFFHDGGLANADLIADGGDLVQPLQHLGCGNLRQTLGQ